MKIQDKFEKRWAVVCRSISLKFSPTLGSILTKMKKQSLKFRFTKLQSKVPSASFMRIIGKKIQVLEKFENFWLRFIGGVAF